MNHEYEKEYYLWMESLRNEYRRVTNGFCMFGSSNHEDIQTSDCSGEIGQRHAISRRHLRIIADNKNMIRAIKEIGAFDNCLEQYESMQLVPISQFSAGKWLCQKHDQMFAGLDTELIDLSNPENLFKAVYRVVLRQNLLSFARWQAHWVNTQSEEDWTRFKESAFIGHVSDEEASKAVNEWCSVARTIYSKADDLGKRLRMKAWDSLKCRAFMLKSQPAVAGWGCQIMKFDPSRLKSEDTQQGWKDFLELGYMIVIPQIYGHAIITACETIDRFRVPEIERIHKIIPYDAKPNEPYIVGEKTQRSLQNCVWRLNELGVKESLYKGWTGLERDEVQLWMKNKNKSTNACLLNGEPLDLPMLL